MWLFLDGFVQLNDTTLQAFLFWFSSCKLLSLPKCLFFFKNCWQNQYVDMAIPQASKEIFMHGGVLNKNVGQLLF